MKYVYTLAVYEWGVGSRFLSCVSILMRDIDIENPSVRYVPVSDVKPIILVLSVSNIFTKFRRGYPYGGTKYRLGI